MIKILLKGPVLTRSGYGEQTRFALRALREKEDFFDIFIQPISWGQTSWLSETSEERMWIDQTIEKTIIHIQQGGRFDATIQCTIPNEWEAPPGTTNIGYTAGIETTKVAHEWIQKANKMDKVIVVSEHSKKVFEDTVYGAREKETEKEFTLKLETPIDSIGYPVKSFDEIDELELDLKHDFNFLTVAQMGPRKNIHQTIKWFIEEFKNDDVGLVLKLNATRNSVMDREHLLHDLRSIAKAGMEPENKCKVYLLHGDMTDNEIHSLYSHAKIKALLSFSHGEGFGLPMFEAAYSGMPVVTTSWSGQADFLYDDKGRANFYDVRFDLQPVPEEVVWEGVIIKESMWCYPKEESAKQQMRLCYTELSSDSGAPESFNPDRHVEFLKEKFSEKAMLNKFCDLVMNAVQKDSEWLEDLDEVAEL
tara:strand:+ start:2958 stop:4217 length:1260 start_codon:yes stop_codon:yes gene_type:complete